MSATTEAPGYGDLFVKGDKILTDQAFVWSWPVTAGYTPYGIRMLDRRFGEAIRAADTLQECRYIGDRLIRCAHLHLTIKENLMLNLVNVMTHIIDGSHEMRHSCTKACNDGKHGQKTCVKRHMDEL